MMRELKCSDFITGSMLTIGMFMINGVLTSFQAICLYCAFISAAIMVCALRGVLVSVAKIAKRNY